MAHVWIPSLLRDLTRGQARVDVPGKTVGDVVDALDAAYPGIKGRLYDAGRLNPAIAVIVDGRTALRGLREPVHEQSEVHFLPAIAGGG
jgi:molybdopterin synthase sulfur carrier subunit